MTEPILVLGGTGKTEREPTRVGRPRVVSRSTTRRPAAT
jgi:hypothetical protein